MAEYLLPLWDAQRRGTVSYVVYAYNSAGQRSEPSNVVIHPAPPVALPRITDLRIENGELRWTAPANVSRYSIRFYTGETTSRNAEFNGCSADILQMQDPYGPGYCVGTAQVISRNRGSTERVRIGQSPVKSFIVTYDDGKGNRSAVSNVAVYRSAVSDEDLQLWGPTSARFYRLKVGESLLLTAGTDYSKNPVLTNFKTDQLVCASVPASYGGSQNINAKWLCTARYTGNGNSEVYFTIGDQRSRTIVIQVDPLSATPPPPSSLPPAGYEDAVLTNIDTYRNPFPDTSLNTLGGKAASELYRRAVIGGFPDGEFKGRLPVNRAEAAKFLILASTHKDDFLPELLNGGKFPDVLDGQWYTKYVIGAANLGIISGHPDGTFRPADTVNTAEFLKMLSLTFGLRLNQSYPFTDVSANDWYAPYAGIAQQYHLFPDRTTRLYPERTLTREDVAVAIYQYLQNR